MTTDPFFRLIVEDVFGIVKRGTVVTGKIEAGTLKAVDQVMLRSKSGEKTTVVTSIESFRKVVEEANAGDRVGLLLKDISRGDVRRGDEILSPGPDFSWKP